MKKSSKGFTGYVVILTVLLMVALLVNQGMGTANGKRIEYPALLEMIKNDQVERVAIRNNQLVGLVKGTTIPANQFPDQRFDFETTIGDDFIDTVRQIQAQKDGKSIDEISVSDLSFQIEYRAPVETPWWIDFLPFLLTVGLFMVLWYFMMRAQSGGNNKVMNFGKSRARVADPSRNKVTFADVAGADEEKEELSEIVEFLRDPDRFKQLGAKIPKGVLLVGPPGTGKTLLARAVAGEANVAFLSISGSDFVELYVGVGASRVRDLFEQAKRVAPAIVFIDEIDAVGRQRGAGLGGGHDEREQTLNQLLVEMDGFSANEGVIVIAATNRKDILDPALLRPGRFDRQIYVGAPDWRGRLAILQVHARKKPLADNVDLPAVAKATAGFTGADLANLLNEGALLAARRGKAAISQQDLETSMIKVIAGPEKKSRVVSHAEKMLTAVHEAGHAICMYCLDSQDPVHLITIIPRAQAGGMTISLPQDDRSYSSRNEMFETIVSFLGGRVAEAQKLCDISTGASNDLQRATGIARDMVAKYGMSDSIGPVSYAGGQEVFIGRDYEKTKPYSEQTAGQIDAQVQKIMREAYQRCEQILHDHAERLDKIAGFLMENENMSRAQFETVMQDETLDQPKA